MYNAQWRDTSVSDSETTSFPCIVRTTGLEPTEVAPRGYFYFLMAWSWEVEAGDAMKHRYDDVDNIYVLSAKSPYFDQELQSKLGSGRMQYRYQFTLPAISPQVSLDGSLRMVAVMDERREILLRRNF